MAGMVDARFISVWDDVLRVATKCRVNMDTKEVADIEQAEVFNVDICTGQYVEIEDVEYPVYDAEELPVGEDEYWYMP